MSEQEIIDCGGKYEVHPGAKGGWAVVNSETGNVRCSYADKDEAVALAESLNEEEETEEENPLAEYSDAELLGELASRGYMVGDLVRQHTNM